MQTSVVFISFQDTKINQTFATLVRTLNIDSSYFGTSAHTTNFAQVEHNFKKKSNQNLCKAPKKQKKSSHHFHTKVKKFRATQNTIQTLSYKIKTSFIVSLERKSNFILCYFPLMQSCHDFCFL
jgi:hypothetical protein